MVTTTFYNGTLGKCIMERHLCTPELEVRKEHTLGVARFASAVAQRIHSRHPEIIDPDLTAFIAYTHDIGYARGYENHELASVAMLLEDGVPAEVARKTLHGSYIPDSIEGIILTYADMSVRLDAPMTVEERSEELIARVSGLSITQERKDDIITSVKAHLPRFQRYRDLVFLLAGVTSHTEF